MLLLCVNVFNISFLNHSSLSTTASNQQQSEEIVGICRGTIYDKNMIPLVNTPFSTDDNSILDKRYNSSTCSHTVGYIYSDGSGASGLEKTFNNILSNDEKPKVTHLKNPFDHLIRNEPVSTENLNLIPSDNLKTTIDCKIQKIAEKIADTHLERGAIVIMETSSADIVATVSRPDFDRNNIEGVLNEPASPLMNKSLCSYNAGSIFKTITAAAILEKLPADISFECTGTYTADGKDFACNKHDGHGLIDFKTAYAKSCNCFFYAKGAEISGRDIINTAKKFGIGQPLLNCDLYEACGYLPIKETYTDRECANISIGQGEILITPVQAANIMAIIANDGISKEINLADSIVNEYGTTTKNLRKTGEKRIISKENALILGKMMREAVLEGTAQQVQNGVIAIAGKTGTAQTGWVENGETMTHGWFCGFFPYENPKYAMAVFAENGKSGSRACIPAFREIVLEINKLYKMEP